ncbi:MAG TPA: histidine phosphatase family protein [Pyrinomonadaceae bacterium]|nr:histidine phosphatase family protein [Pyrinomonadaceae bacterium]
MKTLLLLRHARPSQSSPTGRDFDRPLVEAGRADARLVGQTLVGRNLAPAVILCSPAARARETTEIVREAAQLSAPPRFDDRLFNATTEQLLAVLSESEDEAAVILLVAHNPGIAELILLLTGTSARVSPGTLARIELDIQTWRDLSADTTGQLAFALEPGEN